MRKNLLTRFFAPAAAALIAVTSVTGCGSGNAGESGTNPAPAADAPAAESGGEVPAESSGLTPVGTLPISETPLEMTMFLMSSPVIVDRQTNDFTKYMEETTGIKWTFTEATQDAYQEKINLLMSTNDYPDAFMFVTPDIPRYGVEEGMLIPLDELIPQYMPNYWGYMQENQTYWTQQVQSDGHIYALAGVNVCYHCRYYNKMWVNMNYIEEIGLGVPETTEEFTEVCRKFLELYPNGVAVTGSVDGWGEQFMNFLSGSFITNPGKRIAGGDNNSGDRLLVSPEGKIVTQANQPEFREYLRWMNELYEMGAIYDGGFTQRNDQFRSLVNQPDAPCLFVSSGVNVNFVSAEENPELYKAFRTIAPLKGPDGTQLSTSFKYNDIQENQFVVTDNCPSPEAALRWADIFYTMEGYLRFQFGADEGTDWTLNPEGMTGLTGDPALYHVLKPFSGDPQNHDWQSTAIQFSPEDIRFGEATDANVDIGTSAGLEKLLLDETREKYEPYQPDPATQFDVIPDSYQMKFTADESDAVQTIAIELSNYIESNMIAFISGARDINSDEDWDAYLNGFTDIGLESYLEVYQTVWDRMNSK